MKLNFTILLLSVLLFASGHLFAGRDTLPCPTSPKTVFEKITGLPKQNSFLQADLNTRIAFHSGFAGSSSRENAFRADYLRLQVQGNITDRIYYKWLQHLNKSNRAGQLDNLPASIDCLGIGFHLTPTLSTFIGKQYADFGGFEYDADPAEVYEYSDLGNYITCFLTGANLSWWFTPTQEIRFQVVDGRSGSAEDTYGILPEGALAAKTPLGYTLNWNGIFQEKFYTRCSFSLFHEGRTQNVYFLTLAAAWIQKRFNMYIDFMYSVEEIDKLGIMSEIIHHDEQSARARHSEYLSWVSRINYRFLPKLNFFVKGMYETASIRRSYPGLPEGKYRTSYGYQGGMEYFPGKDNLRFFLMYRGRRFKYTALGKFFQSTAEEPQSLSLGLIYKIPLI